MSQNITSRLTTLNVSEQSNFQKVVQFNKAFGVQTNTTIQHDIFDKDPKLVAYRLALIEEEVQELRDAIKEKDMTETIDALADILYVVYGACASLGFDADKAFEIVNQSNMSKVCDTEKDAIESVKRYQEEIPQRYDSPAYRRSDDGIHWVVYNSNTMKILKNYKYTPANFSELKKNDL
jgi:predicted HAD superfamily Cof-like phosphohydrolase